MRLIWAKGASMAPEDAIVLACETATEPYDLLAAFERYQFNRQDRVRCRAEEVRKNAALFRIPNPLQRFLIHQATRLTSKILSSPRLDQPRRARHEQRECRAT